MSKKILRSFKAKILEYINNQSLVAKFILIFLFCVFLPIMLSCIAFSYSINASFYEHEYDNLEFMVKNTASELNSIFDEAVALSNIIANDDMIQGLARRQFTSGTDYYSYLTDNNLRDYLAAYISQKGNIEDVLVHIDNDTLLNGGLFWKISEEEKNSEFYKDLENNRNNIILYNEEDVNSSDNVYIPSEKGSRMCFIRKLYHGAAGGRMMGYVKISLKMSSVRELFSQQLNYMSFCFVNEADNIVYVPGDNVFYEDGNYMSDLVSDKDYIICESDFQKISYLKDWKVVGVYDSGRMRQKQITNVALILLINLLIGMVMVGVVYLIYRSYSSRISQLQISMREVENEVFNPVSGSCGHDEIGALIQTYNHMVDKINILINDVYKLEALNKSTELEKTRAELRALQSQVDPHFIFNVLNAILVSSVKNGYNQIVPQISGLSKMIRRLLDWSDDSEPLSNEISFIETYLQLEKFRFGDKFNYDINVSGGADGCSIPKMIIQPIIENACRHGLQGIMGNRYVSVDVDFSDNILTVTVADNGNGIAPDKLSEIRAGLDEEDFSGHIGVKNVYRRLKLYFGERADMRINSKENEGTQVIIRINYEEKEAET